MLPTDDSGPEFRDPVKRAHNNPAETPEERLAWIAEAATRVGAPMRYRLAGSLYAYEAGPPKTKGAYRGDRQKALVFVLPRAEMVEGCQALLEEVRDAVYAHGIEAVRVAIKEMS